MSRKISENLTSLNPHKKRNNNNSTASYSEKKRYSRNPKEEDVINESWNESSYFEKIKNKGEVNDREEEGGRNACGRILSPLLSLQECHTVTWPRRSLSGERGGVTRDCWLFRSERAEPRATIGCCPVRRRRYDCLLPFTVVVLQRELRYIFLYSDFSGKTWKAS